MVPYKSKLQQRVSLAGFCCAALVASVLGAAYAWSRRMHGQQPFPIAAHALWMLLPALNTAVAVLIVIAHLTGLPMYQRHWVMLDSAFIYGTSLALACLYFTRPPVGALLPNPFYMALLHANCGNLFGELRPAITCTYLLVSRAGRTCMLQSWWSSQAITSHMWQYLRAQSYT